MAKLTSAIPAWAILGLALVGLLVPLPNDYRCPWLFKCLDLGHVPLFFLITFCLAKVLGNRRITAIGLAALLAVLIEIVQSQIDRSGDVWDVVRGWIGITIAALILYVPFRPRRWQPFVLTATLAILLLIWPIYDCGPVIVDAVSAYRSFPVLSDFQSRWEPLRWYIDGARLARQATDERQQTWAGCLQLQPGKESSGVILFPVKRDWSHYDRVTCEFSFSGDPLRVLISIRDGRKVHPPQRRFDLEKDFSAGRHCVVIDLHALAEGKEFAPIDLTHIQSFHFAAKELNQPRTLWLHRLELE